MRVKKSTPHKDRTILTIDVQLHQKCNYPNHTGPEFLPLTEFAPAKRKLYGVDTKCRNCRLAYNRTWRENNKKKVHDYQEIYWKNYYQENKEQVLQKRAEWKRDNKEYNRQKELERYHNNISKSLWRGARERAKKKGIEFTITPEHIIIPEYCPVFGLPIFSIAGGKKQNDNSPSIDRINNDKGYTPDNIVVVSLRANIAKNRFTMEELSKIVEFYTTKIKMENNYG